MTAKTGDGGYGSKLINRAIASQLGGTLSCDWHREGLVVTLVMKRNRLEG